MTEDEQERLRDVETKAAISHEWIETVGKPVASDVGKVKLFQAMLIGGAAVAAYVARVFQEAILSKLGMH